MSTRPRNNPITKKRIAISALAVLASMHATAAGIEMESELVQNDPLAEMRIVGPANQPMLVVPVTVPGWAANLGVTGAERVYKGLCGPSGATISVDELIQAAEQDFNRASRLLPPNEIVGSSPAFAMTYDNLDPTLIAFYLPPVRSAIEYVDAQLDNRVQIDASFAIGTFGGDVIGSAGSSRFVIPWSVYAEGLRAQSLREDSRFAESLPTSSINVLYNGSTSPTTETSVRVTAAQLRAIFGDNAVPHTQDVSITFNSATAWSFFGCGIEPTGSQLSLIDVAVHELTHALGFTSGINEGGNNPDNEIEGLDIARFRLSNLPGSNAEFGTKPRLGEQFTAEIHFYSSFPTGTSTLLESGDDNQPSHLNFFSSTNAKLGVMDPVINRGTTRCPSFYSSADLQPLDDMGWRPVAQNVLADCNSNGIFDSLDIALGNSLDNDGDGIPDECESFQFGQDDPGNPIGIVRTVYETPGLTNLTSFNPASPSVTPVFSTIVSDATESLSFPNSNTRVVEYKGFINAPLTDEYAFRVGHPDDMILRIDGNIVGQSTHAGSIQRVNSTTSISTQGFVQLYSGWHTISVQYLSNSSAYPVRLVWESRTLGPYQDVVSGDLQIGDDYSDCDNNGNNDFVDIHDDLSNLIDLGIVGESGVSIQFDTIGSSFDTELALWNDLGTLIDSNDDIDGGPIRQSSIITSLDPGQYTIAITGYNTEFYNGPDYEFINGCSDSGFYKLNIAGTEIISGSIPAGRAHIFTFTIGDQDCDMDGTPDSAELDCDGDGIPDDCQLPTSIDADFIGVLGTAGAPFIYSTCGSDFDTEIAIWDELGTLLAVDDDTCGLQSQITTTLDAGIYYGALSGYDTVYSSGFGININANGECAEGGNIEVVVGTLTDAGDIPPGRVIMFSFEIEDAPVCPADLTGDGILDFFDISVFITAYSSNDPIADFTMDGVFDFFDISAFVTLYSQGCP